jgi:hypothetical protein
MSKCFGHDEKRGAPICRRITQRQVLFWGAHATRVHKFGDPPNENLSLAGIAWRVAKRGTRVARAPQNMRLREPWVNFTFFI